MKKLMLMTPLILLTTLSAQDVQVSRTNKTIAVTADESVSVEAEIAEIKIGYRNFALTKNAAFQENNRVSNAITASFIKAGVKRESIETADLVLERTDPGEHWTPEQKKERQFRAYQAWSVRVSVNSAQSLIDLAVRNGANEIEHPTWDVVDPNALQARASSAALAKARSIAEQMAKGLGARLGDLVYASNKAPATGLSRLFTGTLNTQAAIVGGGGGGEGQHELALQLFPEKVKKEATVHAVFAIE